MNICLDSLARGALIGVGATAAMDLYAIVANRVFGLPTSNWAFVGRWVGHFRDGQFVHDSIASATSVRGEHAIGWLTHYLVGAFYGVLLLAICGLDWAQRPTLLPALLVGLSMLVAPFFIMQPGMGAGVASSKTPNPNAARLRSVLNHAVFGLGMYATAWLLVLLAKPAT